MSKTFFAFSFALMLLAVPTPQNASAQSEVLAEMYGRGVHAYFAGDYIAANEFLTMAIDNGTDDPRAYYFRGLVSHTSGRQEEAKDDWNKGAEMEASGKASRSIGKSLSRFQGTARLELESIRQTARLKALASAAARSKARYGELREAESRVLRQPPQPAPSEPDPVTPPAVAPSAPPAGVDQGDPFADDMKDGQPSIESGDALEGAMEDPFAGDNSVPADAVPPNDTSDPFGGGDAGGGADPFGGGDAGGGADPFGGSDAGGADPFGGGAGAGAPAGGADPFGGGAGAPAPAGGADPFGGGAGAPAPAGGADPFGGGAGAGAGDAMEEDPFGGGAGAGAPAGGADPFGGGADGGAGAGDTMEEDPFGGNPFDN